MRDDNAEGQMLEKLVELRQLWEMSRKNYTMHSINALNSLQKFILIIIPILFGITLHEVAHGWVALKLGDKTAKILGRLTLNPIKHIDIIGTVLVPILLFFTTGFVFGWAKPVPVTWENLKNPKRDMAIVALAGPLANLLMALFWGLIGTVGVTLFERSNTVGFLLIYIAETGIFINLVLMILNLIPIPPLDGSRILASFLPKRLEYNYLRLEAYGLLILMALLFLGILEKILIPPVYLGFSLLCNLFGLPLVGG